MRAGFLLIVHMYGWKGGEQTVGGRRWRPGGGPRLRR